ncbi:Hypothetical predicted protein, partial [Pelobates cultripes]
FTINLIKGLTILNSTHHWRIQGGGNGDMQALCRQGRERMKICPPSSSIKTSDQALDPPLCCIRGWRCMGGVSERGPVSAVIVIAAPLCLQFVLSWAREGSRGHASFPSCSQKESKMRESRRSVSRLASLHTARLFRPLISFQVNLLSVAWWPSAISYGTTDYVLNDRHLYPNFFRMLQNYHVYYKIICQLLKHFGWTWVGIVSSYDDTGETEELALKKYMAYYGICMAFKLKLNNYALSHAPEKTMRQVEAVQNTSANVIIVFGSANYIVLKTLLIGRDIFKDKTFVFPPSWVSNEILRDHFINIFDGSLYIELYPLPLPDSGYFFEYIRPSKRPNDKLLENIWISELKCLSPNASKNRFYETVYKTTLINCTGKDPSINAKENLHRGVTPRVYFAVLAMCSALQRYLKRHFLSNNIQIYNYRHQIRGGPAAPATRRLSKSESIFSTPNAHVLRPRPTPNEPDVPGFRKEKYRVLGTNSIGAIRGFYSQVQGSAKTPLHSNLNRECPPEPTVTYLWHSGYGKRCAFVSDYRKTAYRSFTICDIHGVMEKNAFGKRGVEPFYIS